MYKAKKGSILYKYSCTQPLHKPGFYGMVGHGLLPINQGGSFRSGSWDALSYCALKSMSQSNLVLNVLPSVLILQLIQESVFTR